MVVDKDAVRRGYDELAEAYAADRNEDGHGREVLSRFLDGVSESARVLDAGCGQGTPVLRDLDSAATAVGTDISRSQLELAAENVPDVALAQGDMVGGPFRNGFRGDRVPLADPRPARATSRSRRRVCSRRPR